MFYLCYKLISNTWFIGIWIEERRKDISKQTEIKQTNEVDKV